MSHVDTSNFGSLEFRSLATYVKTEFLFKIENYLYVWPSTVLQSKISLALKVCSTETEDWSAARDLKRFYKETINNDNDCIITVWLMHGWFVRKEEHKLNLRNTAVIKICFYQFRKTEKLPVNKICLDDTPSQLFGSKEGNLSI